jgi:hypothetical protein
MDSKLELKLKEKYPKILEEMYSDPIHSCMAFGIETDNGFYNLIDILLFNIQNYCNNISSENRKVSVIATQIKSKFATLRFYFDMVCSCNNIENNYDVTDEEYGIVCDMIHFAESMSEVTCEKCGNVGTTYTIGWHKTLCKQHAIESYGEEKVENYLMQLNKKN